MNALLRVTIKVDAAEAAKLRAIAADLKAVQAAARQTGSAVVGAQVPAELSRWQAASNKIASAFTKLFSGLGSGLVKIGKNLQWTGRQLEFRLTLPILAAAAAATKFALDNERAFTRLEKVYGSASDSAADLSGELDALRDAFRALSDLYGVAQSEVIEIGAAWAQAGAQGATLAKVTKATLDVMILGSMDAAQATTALIQVMSAYRLSADELTQAIAVLNMVENESAANFQDLIEVIERSAGVALNAGVSIRELAAMTASLVPVAGTAENVGNAIKSMANKIMIASGPTADALALLGVEVADLANLGLTERLELMAEGWSKLTQNEKVWVGANLATMYQSNRIVTLLDDLTSANSRYRSAMDATADSQRNLNQLQREIGIYLSSTPQAFDILTTRIKNLMAEAILPLLPLFQVLLQYVVQAVQWFTNLDPSTQKLIAVFVGFLAVLGPIIAYLGVLLTVVGELWTFFGKLAEAVWFVLKTAGGLLLWIAHVTGITAAVKAAAIAVGTWVSAHVALALGIAALVVVVGILAYAFREEIGAALRWLWDNLSKLPAFFAQVFNAAVRIVIQALGVLPRAVAAVFTAVIRIIAAAAQAFYSFLQYFNPFARHSPSLVENVQAGVAIIIAEYQKLGAVGANIKSLAEGFGAFFEANKSLYASFAVQDLAEEIEAVSIFGQTAVESYLGAKQSIIQMTAALADAKKAIEAQEQVVKDLERALDEANRQIDAEENLLQKLEADAEALEEAVADARREIERLGDMSLLGQGAIDDALFINEMEQKQIQLQIAYAKSGGADDEALQPLQDALDALQNEADIIRLQADLQYDPQMRQIDQLVNPREEMGFEEIMAGIQAEQAKLATLEPELDAANKAIEDKRAYIELLKTERDVIEQKLEAERAKLEELEAAYDAIEGAIRDMEAALDDFLSRAQEAQQAAETAAASAAAGAAGGGVGGGGPIPGDWEIPAGTGVGFDEGGSIADIEALTAEWEAMAEEMFGNIDIDIGKWFDDLWQDIQQAWSNLGANIGGMFGSIGDWLYDKLGLEKLEPVWAAISGFFTTLGSAIGAGLAFVGELLAPIGNLFTGLFGDGGTIDIALDWFGQAFSAAFDWVSDVWEEFINSDFISGLGTIFSGLVETVSTAWEEITKTIEFWAEKIMSSPLTQYFMEVIPAAITALWEYSVGIFNALVAFISGIWDQIIIVITTALSAIWSVLQPVVSGFLDHITNTFNLIWSVVQAVWDAIVRIIDGALQIVRGVIQVFGGLLRGDWETVWNGIKDILAGAWNIILAIVNVAKDTFLAIMNYLWQTVQNIWNTIMGVIYGAATGIVTIIEGMGRLLYSVWNTIWQIAEAAWNGIKNGLIAIADGIKSGIGSALSGIWDVVKGIINSVVGIINTFIDGINWVITKVGLSPLRHVSSIGGGNPNGASVVRPTAGYSQFGMASGGVVPIGGGMKVNQATAVVGEGSRAWPEYVIPTDPQYRNRALFFLMEAMKRFGLASGGMVPLPAYSVGGWIMDRVEDGKDLITSAGEFLGKTALRAALAGPSKIFDLALGALPSSPFFMDVFKRVVKMAKDKVYTWLVNFGDTNPEWVSRQMLTPQQRAVYSTVAQANTTQAIWTPSNTPGVRPVRGFARNGAIVRPRPGGVDMTVAEGGRAEGIFPLPDNWEDGFGKTVVNIYGNLEFPNITDPNDAEAFIRNLEALAS